MKLTWSEASVFAFVWACALGYIVASRILEWNFERFLPSNWYFVVKKRLAQPEAKFLRTEKVPKKISNVLEELLTLMQTGNLQKSTVRMDRIFQEKVVHEIKLLEGRGLSRQLHFTNVKLSEGNAKKRDFRHWSDSGREWREVIVEAAVSDKYLHRDSGKVIHESIYPMGRYCFGSLVIFVTMKWERKTGRRSRDFTQSIRKYFVQAVGHRYS